ncbi:MAG TPA: response regulator [Rudaea sp.]|nr:response regulator [Rudaea sp.]
MRKVLICDDSPAELANLNGILTDAGWQTLTTTSGAEAIARAKSEKPALILLDIMMPNMDGYEACRTLQADAETRAIPVVFVSVKNQKADHVWAKLQGAKALIGKPYTPDQIFEAVKAYA